MNTTEDQSQEVIPEVIHSPILLLWIYDLLFQYKNPQVLDTLAQEASESTV